ncbi:MAG TPA: MFS transporter [Opitutaceae bacterium]
MNLPHFARALGSRNYRLYFGGQCVSLLGSWMTSTAAAWLVYRISNKPFDVGLIYFFSQVPVFILAPLIGVWMDRVDVLKVVRVTQALSLIQSSALAVFTFTGHMTVASLCWLSTAQGLINALDFPARQTLTPQLAGERDLLDNVIALNSITFNLARLVGPAIAGFVIYELGPGACFTVDAASYLAVLFALFAVRLQPRPARAVVPHPWDDLRDGVRYTWNHPEISRALSLVFIVALLGFAHSVLAPVFAQDVYFGDSRTLGFLMAATAVGSLAGGIYLGALRSTQRIAALIGFAAIIDGVGLLLLGGTHGIAWGFVSFAITGAGSVIVLVGANTLLQTHVDDEKRGRVLSFYSMVQSVFPFGSVIIGAVAGGWGPRWAVAACGAACVIGGLGYGRAQAKAALSA